LPLHNADMKKDTEISPCLFACSVLRRGQSQRFEGDLFSQMTLAVLGEIPCVIAEAGTYQGVNRALDGFLILVGADIIRLKGRTSCADMVLCRTS